MEELIGWRILSAVEEIFPGRSARTRAKFWQSPYASEVLLLEMMAQTGGLVVGAARDFQTNLVFAKVENAAFTEYGNKETELVIEASAEDGVGEQGTWIEARVSAGSVQIAAAKLFLIDAGDLIGTGKSVTFHAEFLDYYQVREKIKN